MEKFMYMVSGKDVLKMRELVEDVTAIKVIPQSALFI